MVHEDDAERAVRAALALVDAVEADVRVAVNTGEALVRVDAGADPGFGVVGDVVNTASRLQGAAPVGGVLVGKGTVRAARPDGGQRDGGGDRRHPQPRRGEGKDRLHVPGLRSLSRSHR